MKLLLHWYLLLLLIRDFKPFKVQGQATDFDQRIEGELVPNNAVEIAINFRLNTLNYHGKLCTFLSSEKRLLWP